MVQAVGDVLVGYLSSSLGMPNVYVKAKGFGCEIEYYQSIQIKISDDQVVSPQTAPVLAPQIDPVSRASRPANGVVSGKGISTRAGKSLGYKSCAIKSHVPFDA